MAGHQVTQNDGPRPIMLDLCTHDSDSIESALYLIARATLHSWATPISAVFDGLQYCMSGKFLHCKWQYH